MTTKTIPFDAAEYRETLAKASRIFEAFAAFAAQGDG